MSDEYTPTTNEVGYIYALHVPEERQERDAFFDRWIAEHDREVAERCAQIADRCADRQTDVVSEARVTARNIAGDIRAAFADPKGSR